MRKGTGNMGAEGSEQVGGLNGKSDRTLLSTSSSGTVLTDKVKWWPLSGGRT